MNRSFFNVTTIGYLFLLPKDQKSKDEASRTITSSEEKMEKERSKQEEYEASLEREERVLEGIQESLKGMFCSISVRL